MTYSLDTFAPIGDPLHLRSKMDIWNATTSAVTVFEASNAFPVRYHVNETIRVFNLESIPPGDYKLFAWQAMERGSYLDPEFLQQFEELGKAVSLKEGASMSVQLDAIPAE